MVTPNRKYLMQSPTDPAKWEALEILATDPSQHFRTELDTEGAVRRRDDGGFMIVPSRQYNSALADVSEAIRRKREAPPPPSGSSAKAADVAREAEAEGRSVGPAMMAELGNERAALAGHRVQPRAFRKPSPEMLAQAEAEQEGFQQGLRLRGEPPARSSAPSQPRVAANGVGDMPAFRPPTTLRPPSDRSEPMSEAEGVLTRTATPTRDEEFAAAQDEANRRGLMAGLGRAGARLNEAFTGVGGDTAFYDNLAKESDSPVRQLLAQREADKRRALEDPSSEQSQRIQAWVSKALPGVYTQEEISQMTAGDADMVTRYGEMRQRLDQRAADRTAMAEQRAADIAREDAQRLDDRQWQSRQAAAGRAFTASENAKNREADLAEAQARAAASGVAGQKLPAGEAAALGEAEAAVQSLKDLGAAYDKDIDSGFGSFATGATQYLPGTDAALYEDKMRATAQSVGTFLEGGKLAAGDEVKYLRMLPTPGDGAERKKGKIENLNRLISLKRQEKINALRAAGFNLGNLGTDTPPQTASAPSLPREVRNGKTYELENGQWYEVL